MGKLKFTVFALLCIHIIGCGNDFDESKPISCDIIRTIECGQGGECQVGTAESIGMPQTLKINFKDEIISGMGKDQKVRTTKIQNLERVEDKLILHGIQNGKAWSMVITEATGKMTLSVSDNQVGYIVFGLCNPQ